MIYEFDADYKKMYFTLFNAVTDATEELVKLNIGNAKSILIAAQEKCEDMFLDYGEEDEEIEAETDAETESESEQADI